MADNLQPPDAFDERDHQFVQQQGISEVDYTELLELANVHAAATPLTAGAQSWRFVGPRNVGGRIVSLGQDPTDPRIIYAGSAQGGLWRSIDSGDTWERLGDPSHVFPVATMAIPAGAPNVIYFGTGAQRPEYVSGRGIFRATVDKTTGLANVERLAAPDTPDVAPKDARPGAAFRYTRVRVDPDDPTRFWAASQTGLWRCECPLASPAVPSFTREFPDPDNKPDIAALASTPTATTGLWPAHCSDVLVAHDPRETEKVELNGVKVPRYLILFVAIDTVGVFRGRFDRNDTASRVTFDSTPLDMGTGALNFSRIQLAQCERLPQHVYAVMADTATSTATEVYHSANNGDDWKKGTDLMTVAGAQIGQGDYNLVLEVAPDDPSVVICGAIELCLSRNFGDTWIQILDRLRYDSGDKAQHADQHIAIFDRGDHRRLWLGNDGGLSMARDLRMTPQAPGYWRKRSHGIYAGMCQDVAVSPAFPFLCAAGLQDNGAYLSIGGPTWYHIGGGDGGGNAFNLANPRQYYVGWQGDPATGDGLVQVDAVAFDSPPTPPPAPHYYDELVTLAAHDVPETVARGHGVRYRWTAPLADVAGGVPLANFALFAGVIEQHPTVPGSLLLGRAGDGFSSTNFGVNWAPLIAAGPIAPAVGLVTHAVTAMAFGHAEPSNPAPANVDGWAGTSTGTLFFTNNAPAGAWAIITAPLPFPGVAMRVSEITVHPTDRRIVAVSVTGIQGRVFLSYDQGHSWIDVTEPVPTSMDVLPVGASVQVGETRPFTAIARYPGGVLANVTARAAWSSSLPLKAAVTTALGSTPPTGLGFPSLTDFGSEGRVTGGATGAPNPSITATLLLNIVPNGSASQAVTITPAAGTPPVHPTPPQPRDVVPGSIPPGPVASVIFDPSVAAAAPMRLLAGTLAGVYALSDIPAITSIAIQPAPGPLVFQTGAAVVQLRCVATLTGGAQIDITKAVDWSNTAVGAAVVSNTAPNEGQVTIGVLGSDTITATRAGVPPATLVITVQAGPAAAPPALPVIAPSRPAIEWRRYDVGLPRVLVTDLERVGATNAIRAATFGLGVFECVTAGGPNQRTFIRQTIIEDGRSNTRTAPLLTTHDPRFPAGVLALDFTHSFDIRLDAPPYSFFDDVVDGVEFDEQLEVADAVPTEINYVYVQVHNNGVTGVPSVSVHLYAAACAAADVINPIGAVATASPASLDAGAPIADFYGNPNRDPLLTSRWTRVDVVRTIDEVPPDAPRVARFAWVPDAALANTNVALLALCEGHPDSGDKLPPAPAGATLSAFILNEHRAALRVVRVGARPPASLYIRDGIADDTRVGGYPAGGRSPDIMVVHPDISGSAADAFKDHMARRVTDTVTNAATNVVYVRVHNRRQFDTTAQVKVFAVPLDDNNEPSHALAGWTELPPAAAFADAVVPAGGVGYARVELPAPNDPNPTGTNKTYLLLALVKSSDNTDALPNKDRVTDANAFWDVVSRFANSDNAASRAVPWVP